MKTDIVDCCAIPHRTKTEIALKRGKTYGKKKKNSSGLFIGSGNHDGNGIRRKLHVTGDFTYTCSIGQRERWEKGGGFPKIKVVDDGEPPPDNVEYMGLVCNIKDTYSEMIKVEQSDGKWKEEEVSTMNLNNIWVSVPGGDMRTRAFWSSYIFNRRVYRERMGDKG